MPRVSYVGRVRREAGDVAFDHVDQIEGRRRVVNMPAGQGVRDDHARSVDAQMKRLPAAYTASAMFHGRPFTFTTVESPVLSMMRCMPAPAGRRRSARSRC